MELNSSCAFFYFARILKHVTCSHPFIKIIEPTLLHCFLHTMWKKTNFQNCKTLWLDLYGFAHISSTLPEAHVHFCLVFRCKIGKCNPEVQLCTLSISIMCGFYVFDLYNPTMSKINPSVKTRQLLITFN